MRLDLVTSCHFQASKACLQDHHLRCLRCRCLTCPSCQCLCASRPWNVGSQPDLQKSAETQVLHTVNSAPSVVAGAQNALKRFETIGRCSISIGKCLEEINFLSISQLCVFHARSNCRAAFTLASLSSFCTRDLGFHPVRSSSFFPKQCGHTQGVRTVRVKGPVFNRGGRSSVRAFLPVNYHKKSLF